MIIGTKVKVYRNLNNGMFSIKAKIDGKEKVIGYADTLTLKDVTFTGSHSKAQSDIQKGAHRSVHAYAVGTLVSVNDLNRDLISTLKMELATYKPKERAGFYIVSTNQEINESKLVRFENQKMFVL